jgi:hypothetical protein
MEALGMPSGSYGTLVNRGILPTSTERGVHDLIAIFAGYAKYLDGSRAEQRAASGPMAEAKLRLTEAQAALAELEAEQRAGALIPLAHAELVSSELVSQLRAEIDGMAGRLAAELSAESDAALIRRTLLVAYRGACDRAADKIARLAAPVPPPPGPPGDADATAAGSDGAGMVADEDARDGGGEGGDADGPDAVLPRAAHGREQRPLPTDGHRVRKSDRKDAGVPAERRRPPTRRRPVPDVAGVPDPLRR